MFALGCRCARHIFRQWQKECCHGNSILWQNWGKNLASRTTSSVFHQFSWNLAQMFALGCRCARHIFFDSGRKCVAMVKAYYGKNGGKILRRELLPQFFTNSHEIWQRCLPWGVDVQDTFFWQWQKVCCHGNGILWQKWGNLASRTTSSVFRQFSWNLAQMFALECRCARHIFFDSGRKCVAMVTAYYGQNGGEILRRELLPQFFTNSHEIWHRCLPLGIDVQDTFFWQWQKVCCHGNGILWQKWGENLASRTTSSVFHQFSWNLVQIFALECRCARHIFLRVAESVLPW